MNSWTENSQLQLFLNDKKNPWFALYRKLNEHGFVYIFFGGMLLEKVTDEPSSMGFKHLIGRLFNAGISRKAIQKNFKVASTTQSRYGKAVRSKSIEEMGKAFREPGFIRKITPEVEAVIARQFQRIYPGNRYSYNQKIRKELEDILDLKIGASTLQPILHRLKADWNQKEAHTGDSIPNNSGNCGVPNSCGTEQKSDEYAKKETEIAEDKEQELQETNRQHALQFYSNKGPELNRYAGLLLFESWLRQAASLSCTINISTNLALLIPQWIATILSGAMNIEQTKLLDMNAMEVILGQVARSLNYQRTSLKMLTGEDELAPGLLKFNWQLVEGETQTDLYFDPHCKQYTGAKKILKGWCSAIRFADKKINMDFIHTVKGHPVYLENTDNFEDERTRFKKIIERFRSVLAIPDKKQLTFVADRGIYKIELLESMLGTKNHFVTWEKGYTRDGWNEQLTIHAFENCRAGNDSTDFFKYKFSFIDQKWTKRNAIRQLIVRATNPKGRTIEVSILTSDHDRNASEIILLMTGRWVQENDFKYLNTHFGINQITTYDAEPYQDLSRSIQDRDTVSIDYRVLQMELYSIKKDLGKLLLQQKECKLKKKQISLEQRVAELMTEKDQTEQKLSETIKTVSRYNTLVEKEFWRLNTSTKFIMDIIKCISRNIFYQAFQPFKKSYDNFRDDHVIFRNLTRSLGAIHFQPNSIDVILVPSGTLSKKARQACEDTISNINQSLPILPDGSNRKIHFSLYPKSSRFLAIQLPRG